jgi:hypothetical protein
MKLPVELLEGRERIEERGRRREYRGGMREERGF